jgi:hypothetical protein
MLKAGESDQDGGERKQSIIAKETLVLVPILGSALAVSYDVGSFIPLALVCTRFSR